MILNDTMAYGPIAFNDEMEILISKNGEEEMGQDYGLVEPDYGIVWQTGAYVTYLPSELQIVWTAVRSNVNKDSLEILRETFRANGS